MPTQIESGHAGPYSDTQLPDIFITDYLPRLSGNEVKAYICILHAVKGGAKVGLADVAGRLAQSEGEVGDAVSRMVRLGLLEERPPSGLALTDLKGRAVDRLYRPRTSLEPGELAKGPDCGGDRDCLIKAISNTFFQGLMSATWYSDIEIWFERYGFEEAVMYQLFQYCHDAGKLVRNYVLTVAGSWHEKGIRTTADLNRYFMSYQATKDISAKISRKLRLGRSTTSFEDELVEKWITQYRYGFEVIEMALRKTTGRTNPSFKYIDAVLSGWKKDGLDTKEAIEAGESGKAPGGEGAQKGRKAPAKGAREVPQQSNFGQREYEDEYIEGLYENKGGR